MAGILIRGVTFDAGMQSIMSPRQTAEQRQFHKENFLAEFDMEVATRHEQMKLQLQALVSSMQQRLAFHLIKIPKHVRNMTVGEFVKVHCGDDQKVTDAEVAKQLAALPGQTMPPPSTVRKTISRKRKGLAETSNIQQDTAPPTTVKKQRLPAFDTSIRAQESLTTPSTMVRRSKRSSSIKTSTAVDDSVTPTPARTRRSTAANNIMATPLLDHRLPKTPFTRQPKRGESFISLNGSPVSLHTKSLRVTAVGDEPAITVPLPGGKALMMGKDMDIVAASKNMSKRAKLQAREQLSSLKDQVQAWLQQLA